LQLHVPDLHGYLDILRCPDNWFDLPIHTTTDALFYETCSKHLLSSANAARIVRIFSVRRFYAVIGKAGFIGQTTIRLHPFKKGYAYMLDRGELHLLSDLLLRSTLADFLSVILHETAHLRISTADSYEQLLQLDLLFAENFLKNRQDTLLKTITPVEFFAQIMSVGWLKELARRIPEGRIQSVLKEETEKAVNKLLSAVSLLPPS